MESVRRFIAGSDCESNEKAIKDRRNAEDVSDGRGGTMAAVHPRKAGVSDGQSSLTA